MKKKINFKEVFPNFITILGLCLGISSIKFAFELNFEKSIYCIVLAAILDAIDGRIARFLKSTSKFGAELDALVDFVNFGISPALILYFYKLNTLPKFGWILCLVFIICACLRLARFNSSDKLEKNTSDMFFNGVPVPSGAGLILLPIIFSYSGFSAQNLNMNIFVIFISITSFLMISKIPTYSLKSFKISRTAGVILILILAIYFIFLYQFTFETLLISGILYLLLIPVSFLHYARYKKKNKNLDDSLISDDFI